MIKDIEFRAFVDEKMVQVSALYRDGCFRAYDGVKDKLYLKNDNPIIMQYTRILDKSGIKIFEGDICKNVTADSKYGIVCFDDGMFFFRADDKEMIHHYICKISEYCKVIGNIFENPELRSK